MDDDAIILQGAVVQRGAFLCHCHLQRHAQRPGVQLRMQIQAEQEGIIQDILALIS